VGGLKLFKVELSGFDELQKTLDDAQRAIESLDGDIATLRVDPNNPQAAIAEMERVVDAKLAPYRGNPIVEQISEASKEHFRKGILEQVEEAKRKAIEGEAK
jgi:hypothetical protein